MSKLLTGVALGIFVGILLAPDKGSETRKKLTEKGKDLKKNFNEFVDSLSDKIDSLRSDAEEEMVNLTARSESYSTQPYSA